jgi:ATPase subunit of ABC transporter with duplicated ATPase domains
MIHLQSLSKSHGAKVLFEDVTLSFQPGHRYAVTGPNGSGKSTLMRILMGLEEPTTGQVTVPDRVGFLRQNIEDYRNYKACDTVIMGSERLWEALQERDRLYEGEMTDEVGMRLGELEEIIAEEDGYSAEASAEALLAGIGIPQELHHATMSTLPTDMQFRVLLCQAIFGDPQALLLDEPTNHLDLNSIGWLENFLMDFKGTLIVISHDRHFLNSIATDCADIDYESIILYPGNYDNMVMAKTSVRQSAELDAKSREKKIEKLKEFVAKFGAGTRASQVKSRQREIERLQPQELKKSNIERPYIRFPLCEHNSGQIVFRAKRLCKAYDEPVIENLSFEVERGDKVAIIGNNGRGKTTLIKLMAGLLQPDSGEVRIGHQAFLSYFPQNHEELVSRDDKSNIFEWLRERKKGLNDQEIRSALGKLLFGGDDAFKKVATLSGGETARLILAGMMLEEHNTILLDEPNNHLDLESVSALGWGLSDYKGTVVFASHDRDLVGQVANKIIAFEEDGAHFFLGNLEEYLARRAKESAV